MFFILYPAVSAVYLMLAAGKKAVPDLERVPPLGDKGKEDQGRDIPKEPVGAHEYRGTDSKRDGQKQRRQEACRVKRRFRGVLLPKGDGDGLAYIRHGILREHGRVGLDSIQVYDFPRHLLQEESDGRGGRRIKVMPEFELMPLEITRRTREFQADAQEFSQERRGDDPSEIYQVREYREKDSTERHPLEAERAGGTAHDQGAQFPSGMCGPDLYRLQERRAVGGRIFKDA